MADALSGAAADAPFDAVIVADGFDDLTDPVNDLRALAKLLGEDGQLIVVAANATHAEARL
ncbi:MAG: hypothetical protein Q8K63_04995, partial [Acidimicrobiales bacterium]|nr:hypothetical protein [Acidimicrobiales bacterium]